MSASGDLTLGAALRSLAVPEHAPGFWAAVHHRLTEERTSGLAGERRQRRARVRWTRRAAFAAAVVALAFVAVGLPESEQTGPEVATAAQVKARVASALAEARTVRGRLVIAGEEEILGRRKSSYTFALTEQGDFRLHGLSHREEIAYDADGGAERSYFVDAEGIVSAGEFTGLAPAFPDPAPSDWILHRRYGSVVRALLVTPGGGVRTTEYQGRPAWGLDVGVKPSAIVPELTADRLGITVDRETGFPVRIVEERRGRVLSETTIEELEVNPELPPGTFTFEFPRGAEPLPIDSGFRRVELSEVAPIVGYPPLVPVWVPEGYELAEVAVAGRTSLNTGPEASNPTSAGVVSLSYRRGLDQLVVTTRLTNPPGWFAESEIEGDLDPKRFWGDPLASGEAYRDEPERVTLGRGALAGVEAEVLIVPRNIPHLWALAEDHVVTVGGDLSRAELIRVAESLARR